MFKVSAVQINVHDIDSAIRFYCEVLGFEIENREHYPKVISLKHEGVLLLLSQAEVPTRVDYPKQAQTLLNFRVNEDLCSLVARLKKKGVAFLAEAPSPCPVGRFIPFVDPSGNVHELVEFSKW